MRTRYLHCLVLACLMGVFLTACDQSSQNIDYQVADSLEVKGPRSLTIPNYDSTVTGEWQIQAFSIDKEYTWSVDGVLGDTSLRRQGENLVASTSTPGSFKVSYTTTIDGEEEVGVAEGVADYPSAVDQAARYNLSVFSSAVTSTGLLTQLAESGLSVTAFAPSNAAFLAALDANDDGQLSDAELPAPGVLAQVLRYHAAVDSLTSTEIGDGDTVPTTLDGAFPPGADNPTQWSVPLSFSVANGNVTVNGQASSAGVVGADIATAEGIVLHKMDGVLLPSSVVSVNDQAVTRDTVANVDSVYVEGTYVSGGGFVALHEGGPSGSIIGVSDYLEGSTSNAPEQGFHNSIGIELNSQLSDTTTVVAMPHQDTNGDQQFTFVPSTGTDVPYFRTSNNQIPVIDTARVSATAP
jgi:uncharacterized surface protein with fasciclin (FAS1) repeats